MNDNTIVGSGRVKFTKPGEKYHWVRETEWERQWEADGLLPKRWAVASEPVVVETYREQTPMRSFEELVLDHQNPNYVPWDVKTWWSRHRG